MDFGTSIKTCFSKYAVFSGRASRSEFWWFPLFGLIGGVVTAVIDVMILGYSAEANVDFFSLPENKLLNIVKCFRSLQIAFSRSHERAYQCLFK